MFTLFIPAGSCRRLSGPRRHRSHKEKEILNVAVYSYIARSDYCLVYIYYSKGRWQVQIL